MSGEQDPQSNWRKSSFSMSNGQCVEVYAPGAPAGRIAIRDSQDPKGPRLHFSPNEWGVFIGKTKKGPAKA